MAKEKTYRVRNSEKCFRFKPEALAAHAPDHRGIYELVTFDENQNPRVLYVGAAFEKGIQSCLEGHADGTLTPPAADLLTKHSNLYFDYLTEMDAKSMEDAQDVYWWLVQKYGPLYNDKNAVHHSGRYESIHVI